MENLVIRSRMKAGENTEMAELCRWDGGRLERKLGSALKPFDSVANCCSFVPSSEVKFSKMKSGDCNIRVAVNKVCCLLISMNTALSRGCRMSCVK